MTKSCKSQGRKNKTMKKNTKKMQGGDEGQTVISNSGNTDGAPNVPPLVNPKAPATTTPDNSFFGFKLPKIFGSKATTGGKRKSKSNKSNRKKSKYNKK
jgi:hypothetical protein